MPYTSENLADKNTLVVAPSGFLSGEERSEILELLCATLAQQDVSRILFDLRGLTSDNDPNVELTYGPRLISALAPFPHARSAVVLSQDFLMSSNVVLVVQQAGINMVDFRDIDEAKTWLWSESD